MILLDDWEVPEGERLLFHQFLKPSDYWKYHGQRSSAFDDARGHLLRKVDRERELVARAHVATVTLL